MDADDCCVCDVDSEEGVDVSSYFEALGDGKGDSSPLVVGLLLFSHLVEGQIEEVVVAFMATLDCLLERLDV